MNKLIEQIERIKTQTVLSTERKQDLREELISYMKDNPVVREESGRIRFAAIIAWFSRPMYVGSAFAVVVLILGGTTVAAANSATPDSSLYRVKTSFNEPVRGAFIFDDNEKISYEAKLAERRLIEANQLAAVGKLNAETQAKLSANFDIHARKVESRIQQLKEGQEPEKAERLAEKFATAVVIQNETLVQNSQEDDNTLGEKISKTLQNIAEVSEAASVSAVSRINSANTAIVSTDKSLRRNDEQKVNQKDEKADETRKREKERREAQAKLEAAQKLLLEARTKLNTGKYDEARKLGDRALENADEAQATIEIEGDKEKRKDAEKADEVKKKQEDKERSESRRELNVGGFKLRIGR